MAPPTTPPRRLVVTMSKTVAVLSAAKNAKARTLGRNLATRAVVQTHSSWCILGLSIVGCAQLYPRDKIQEGAAHDH